MILNIQKNKDNPILRKKTEPVKEINTEIKQLALDMVETMEKNQGIGLAAPQVGKLFQIITVKPEPDQQTLVLINPKIKKTSRKKDVMLEGCLSLPDINLPVERAIKITVKGLDVNGKKIKIKAEGLLARAIQHEIDHLSGILITDKIYEEK
jgi:peptide deformylase